MPDYRKSHYKKDITDLEDRLDRLSQAPDEKGILRFESVLEFLFQATQRQVHVITGSLKVSGVRESDHHRGRWRARIRYGGRAAGMPHDPVKYALYEQGRGGEHDFMEPTDFADAMWRDAIVRTLGDDR